MKGQAEVIGAILLLVIAVALWAAAWNLFYPTYQQASQRLERERLLAEKGLKEYLLVERIYLNNGHVCAWVTNTGDVQTELASLYLNNTLAWSGYIDVKAGASIEVCTNFTQRATYRVKVCSYTNCFEVTDYVP
jgi:flagellin-like protein